LKPIKLSRHARDRMAARGATEAEVTDAVRSGEGVTAKRGRRGYRKDFPCDDPGLEGTYSTKQVLVIVAEEATALTVRTVFVFYF